MNNKAAKEKQFYCASCKKICTEIGRWVACREEDQETVPSQYCLSLCPECSKKVFPRCYHVT